MRACKVKLGTALTTIFILAGCGGTSSSPSAITATSTTTPAPVTASVDTTPSAPTASETTPPPQNVLEAAMRATSPAVKDSVSNLAASPLSGVAAKGILSNARIIAFDALMPPEDIGEEGTALLGEAFTNADGEYTLSLQTTEDTSDYLVIGALFEGATMICDAPSGCLGDVAFGEPLFLRESEDALWAIIPKPAPGEATTANVNLFTHFQLFRMLGLAYDIQVENEETDEPITLEAQHFTPAFDFVSNVFGINAPHFHTVPYVDPTQPIGSSHRSAVNMSLLSAGFLEAATQAQIEKEGEEANFDDLFSQATIPFFIPSIFTLNERDTNKNPRLMSLEDIFEGALKTAELNTAQNNSLSLAIDFLNVQNEVIDALPYDARLESDGSYPDEQRPLDPEPEAVPEPETVPETTHADSCQPSLLPNASDEIVLLTGYEGTAYSSVSVASLDRITEVTRVRIETGETPLYILAASFTDMIWSIEGDTDRVAGFVAARGQKPPNSAAAGGAGVVGLPTDKVDFVDYDCIRYYDASGSEGTGTAKAKYEDILARKMDHVLSAYTLSSVAIPSGEMVSPAMRDEIEAIAISAGQDQITADNGIKFNIKSQTAHADQTQLFRFTEEGLATVPVSEVVSPKEVQTYDVFPAEAGLIQLIASGQIEYKGNDDTHAYTYFVHKTFPRFPAGLAGAHLVKFILGKDVEMPGGDIAHSSVYSEETGECLKGIC